MKPWIVLTARRQTRGPIWLTTQSANIRIYGPVQENQDTARAVI